jgi:hypothetical protein
MKYRVFISIIIVEIIVISVLFIMGAGVVKKRQKEIEVKKKIVRTLMLTDLSIWTEARYTRHPSQADWFSPFQDYPSSIEHFPAGSIIYPSALSEVEKEQK